MLLKVAVVLFFLLPLHDTLQDNEIGDEKSSYLKKLTQLYEKLGFSNGAERARRQVLTGMLSDALNEGAKAPGEERFFRDAEITYLSERDGSFEVRLLTSSLRATSSDYELVRGDADFAHFVANVSSIQKLDKSLYAGNKVRKRRNIEFNNGSKGETAY